MKDVDLSGLHTVMVGFPDVFGRLLGKRLTREFFESQVMSAGTHVCNYLLTVDLDMNPLPGFELANWDKGYGDFHVHVDPTTLRSLAWSPGTALVLGDLRHEDGTAVDQAPRTLLRRQLDRLDKQGLSAYAASELEFYLFREGYRAASERGHRDLTPSSSYLIDYHLAQPARDEDVLARLRNELTESGIVVEGTKGEWGRGQHEINLLYGRALEAADGHVICKHAAKEIAAQQDRSITFMAKPSTQDAGSSCHIHFSLWNESGDQSLFSDDTGVTPLFRQFLAGLCKYTRELSYFFAPTVNSYKRYQPESWAPTALVWAHDNRTTGFRVVGQGSSLRIENRMPGADANPYLAYAATIAAGLAGIAESLPCPAPYTGNAYADASLAQLPSSLAQAADLLDASALARSAFGDPVVDYYVHAARLEAAAYGREVSDWERARYFERI